MIARHAFACRKLPRLWLLTDERQGDALWDALEQLPNGAAGIVFRHHGTAPAERRSIYEHVRSIASRRRLVLILSGPPGLARAWRADGSYGAGARNPAKLLRLCPAHDPAEIVAARRAGADAVLLSPVFATRSHPGARPLGRLRFGLMARAAPIPVIALGGMDAARWRGLRALSSYGWAGIDAFFASPGGRGGARRASGGKVILRHSGAHPHPAPTKALASLSLRIPLPPGEGT